MDARYLFMGSFLTHNTIHKRPHRSLREGTAAFTPTGPGRFSVVLPREPLLLAASWDGHQVAVGYEGGDDKDKARVDVYHVGDLRQGDGRPRAAHALPHGLRVLRWTKAGKHRLLAGGGRHLSYLWDDGRLVTRALDRALGAADWSPEQDDVVAVSFFGQGALMILSDIRMRNPPSHTSLRRRHLYIHTYNAQSPRRPSAFWTPTSSARARWRWSGPPRARRCGHCPR